MHIVKVTRNGKITIPKEIRNTLNIKEGDLLEIKEENSKIVIEKLDIPKPGKPIGIDEYMKIMNELKEIRKNWR